MRYAAALFPALFLLSAPALANPLQDGFAAFERQDYQTALKLWQPLAEQGNAKAQFDLGSMYQDGEGVPQDYVEALKWYRMAAKNGLAEAQYQLSMVYSAGWGVKKDEKESLKWMRKAAENGLAEAQYLTGLFIWKDTEDHAAAKEAYKWFRMAADQGDVLAELFVGGYYYKDCDCGVKQDYAEAFKWYHKAAVQGNFRSAQTSIGKMYEKGEGVNQDYVEAYFWCSLSQSFHNPAAISCRDDAVKHLTPEQKSALEKRIDEWTKAHAHPAPAAPPVSK